MKRKEKRLNKDAKIEQIHKQGNRQPLQTVLEYLRYPPKYKQILSITQVPTIQDTPLTQKIIQSTKTNNRITVRKYSHNHVWQLKKSLS